MKSILRNWKTSLLGGGALTGAVINFAENPSDIKGSLLMAAIGLIGLFAKDHNKTGIRLNKD